MAKTPNNGALTQACSVLTHTILGTLVIMLLGLRTMKLWQRSFVSSKYYSFWHAYLDSLCLLYQAKRFPYPSSQPALPMLYVALRERSRFTQETTLATLEHIKYSIFLYGESIILPIIEATNQAVVGRRTLLPWGTKSGRVRVVTQF